MYLIKSFSNLSFSHTVFSWVLSACSPWATERSVTCAFQTVHFSEASLLTLLVLLKSQVPTLGEYERVLKLYTANEWVQTLQNWLYKKALRLSSSFHWKVVNFNEISSFSFKVATAIHASRFPLLTQHDSHSKLNYLYITLYALSEVQACTKEVRQLKTPNVQQVGATCSNLRVLG